MTQADRPRDVTIRDAGVVIAPASWWYSAARSLTIRTARAVIVVPDGPAWPDNLDEVVAALQTGDFIDLTGRSEDPA